MKYFNINTGNVGCLGGCLLSLLLVLILPIIAIFRLLKGQKTSIEPKKQPRPEPTASSDIIDVEAKELD